MGCAAHVAGTVSGLWFGFGGEPASARLLRFRHPGCTGGLRCGFQSRGCAFAPTTGLRLPGPFVLTPFVQHLAKLSMKKAGLWGKPVITLSYKETGARFQELLNQEWGIGYLPVALLDHHPIAAGESYWEVSCEETLTDAANLG